MKFVQLSWDKERVQKWMSDKPTTFMREDTLVNGHVHYTSLDGKLAIAFSNGHNEWKIQPDANR